MIKKLVVSSIDHTLFTVSFIVGVQLPAFIQQYTQFINGKLSEAEFHLSKFQDVANIHFNGDLSLLIERYIINADPAIKQTGEVVEELVQRIGLLEEQLLKLTQDDYIQRVYYFITHLDSDSVQSTAEHFQLAIPLTLESVVTGLVFSITMVLTRAGLFSLFSRKKSHQAFS